MNETVQGVRWANLALALLLEIALLAAFVVVALRLELPLAARVVLAVVLPAVVIVVWGTFSAPRAPQRLGPGPRLLLEVVLFGLAVLALAVVGLVVPAIVLAAVTAVNVVGRALLRQV